MKPARVIGAGALLAAASLLPSANAQSVDLAQYGCLEAALTANDADELDDVAIRDILGESRKVGSACETTGGAE